MMTSELCSVDERRLTGFLAEYAASLLGCGATCVRIEKNVGRIAARFGVTADVTVMPSHIQVSAWTPDHSCGRVAIRRIHSHAIPFRLNARLSRLSWDVADGRCDFPTMLERFDKALATPPTGAVEVLLLASSANASFCRLFGGDLTAMFMVFLATLCGFRLKQVLVAEGVDLRVAVFFSSFFSTSLSAAGYVFGLGGTPEIALGSSVLYLIPGVPYINSVSDVIDRHYLCAFSRFMDAAVLTFCLSVGLCAGMVVLGLHWF